MRMETWYGSENKCSSKESNLRAHYSSPGKQLVGCHWVYTVKYLLDGSNEHLKVQMETKWYAQTYDIDYEETFSLVASLNCVWIILSVAVSCFWPLY